MPSAYTRTGLSAGRRKTRHAEMKDSFWGKPKIVLLFTCMTVLKTKKNFTDLGMGEIGV